MDYELFTFGEFLNSILKKKNISVAKLAALTESKSRNSIQRLLKDESSIDVIQNFKTKLVKLDPICLSPLELKQMEKSIEVSTVGKEVLYARKILLELFQNNKNKSMLYSTKEFGADNKPISLTQLFKSYSNYKSVNIIIFDAAFVELSEALIALIHTAANTKISIKQIIYLSDDLSGIADTFATIYKLLNYRNYEAFYNSLFNSQCITRNSTSVFSDLIVVHKVSLEGTHVTDLIKFDITKGFSLLSNNAGDLLYNFYLDYFNSLRIDCHSIRRTYDKDNTIDKLIDICDLLLYLEKSTAEYLIKQNMCFQMIHPDILYSMLLDSNYLGLSEDDPKIQKLIQLALDRFNNYYSIKKMKINLFTKRGLQDFVKTRTLTDHLYCFRPFTKEEVRFTLEFILRQVEENDYFKLILLRDDYYIGNIEYNYYENHALYLFDSCAGYGEDFDEGIITAKPIINLFDDFIKNELIRHHTLPEAETKDFLKHLISII